MNCWRQAETYAVSPDVPSANVDAKTSIHYLLGTTAGTPLTWDQPNNQCHDYTHLTENLPECRLATGTADNNEVEDYHEDVEHTYDVNTITGNLENVKPAGCELEDGALGAQSDDGVGLWWYRPPDGRNAGEWTEGEIAADDVSEHRPARPYTAEAPVTWRSHGRANLTDVFAHEELISPSLAGGGDNPVLLRAAEPLDASNRARSDEPEAEGSLELDSTGGLTDSAPLTTKRETSLSVNGAESCRIDDALPGGSKAADLVANDEDRTEINGVEAVHWMRELGVPTTTKGPAHSDLLFEPINQVTLHTQTAERSPGNAEVPKTSTLPPPSQLAACHRPSGIRSAPASPTSVSSRDESVRDLSVDLSPGQNSPTSRKRLLASRRWASNSLPHMVSGAGPEDHNMDTTTSHMTRQGYTDSESMKHSSVRVSTTGRWSSVMPEGEDRPSLTSGAGLCVNVSDPGTSAMSGENASQMWLVRVPSASSNVPGALSGGRQSELPPERASMPVASSLWTCSSVGEEPDGVKVSTVHRPAAPSYPVAQARGDHARSSVLEIMNDYPLPVAATSPEAGTWFEDIEDALKEENGCPGDVAVTRESFFSRLISRKPLSAEQRAGGLGDMVPPNHYTEALICLDGPIQPSGAGYVVISRSGDENFNLTCTGWLRRRMCHLKVGHRDLSHKEDEALAWIVAQHRHWMTPGRRVWLVSRNLPHRSPEFKRPHRDDEDQLDQSSSRRWRRRWTTTLPEYIDELNVNYNLKLTLKRAPTFSFW